MSAVDGRWTIKCPAEVRADILRLAHAADLTVAEWLAGAVQAASTAAPKPAYAGELELRPGLLVRHRAGSPTMAAVSPEVVERSPYAGQGEGFSEGGPTGKWWCEWFVRGEPHSKAFDPITLEPAP